MQRPLCSGHHRNGEPAMIEVVIDQRRKDLGGFEVGRVLPFAKRRMVGPFIFFDHMGPVDFAPGISRSVDVRPHPHIGLSTITYLFAGEIMHRDSLGSEQPIRPGEVNWMTAGRGITHSERFEHARLHGGHMDGIQAWVALPVEAEESAPAFTHYGAEALPAFEDTGVWARLIAGEAWGLKSHVHTHSPMSYVHCRLATGATLQVPANYPERAVYVAGGAVRIDGRDFSAGRMVVLSAGSPVVVTALESSVVMLLAGEPLGERYIEWNFVSSSKERIQQAKADWAAGRMKLPDLDNQEFIPLPSEPAPPNPMS
jgi:redox-sensitive bicupin YhaK (pirin superfamily)